MLLNVICKQDAGTAHAKSTIAALHSNDLYANQLTLLYLFTTGGAGGGTSTAAAGASTTTEPLGDGEGKYVLQIIKLQQLELVKRIQHFKLCSERCH
jgi:hypothetical protein